jgi:UDP-glucose 4-epimerase
LMKVLVTGGAGFVGAYVVQALLQAGHEPLIFDRVRPVQGSFFEGDLTCSQDIMEAASRVEAICHLGAVGDVYLALEDPAQAALINVVGTAQVMEAALKHKLHKVIYASTWEVYGHPLYQPIDEEHPCSPDHPYNITKYSGERLALSYDALKGVPAIALRLGTAYGLGMRPNAVFSLFLRQAQMKHPITIQGDGHQARQFTHGSDIGRAFVAALESEHHGSVYNIVARENIAIRQLAWMITEQLPTQIIYTAARIGDVLPALISSARAEAELNWKPQVLFAEGLREIITQGTACPTDSRERIGERVV